MNMISLANFDNFDNQKGFSKETATDEKTEDFSSILNSIFVTLQTPALPVKTSVSEEMNESLKISSEFGTNQDFVAENNKNDNNLLELPEFEQTSQIPTDFELSPELSNVSSLWAGNPTIRQRLNDYKSEFKTFEKFASQNNALFKEQISSKQDKFEILLQTDSSKSSLTANKQDSDIFNLPQLFRVVTDSIKGDNSKLNKFDTNSVQAENLYFDEHHNIEQNSKVFVEGLPQNLNHPEIENPTFEKQLDDNDLDFFANLTEFGEAVSKEHKINETFSPNSLEKTKMFEQINPHLLELAALAARKNEKQTLSLRLHPAELGTIEIKLERNSSGMLNAFFQTDTDGARQVLTNSLEQLRDSLQNAGWQIGQLEITNGSNSSTANQHRENNSRQFESVGNYDFNRSSEKPDDLERNSSNRLLSLLA